MRQSKGPPALRASGAATSKRHLGPGCSVRWDTALAPGWTIVAERGAARNTQTAVLGRRASRRSWRLLRVLVNITNGYRSSPWAGIR